MKPFLGPAAAIASSLVTCVALTACSSNSPAPLEPQVAPPSARQSVLPQATQRYRFVVLPYKGKARRSSGGQIPLWNGSFTYSSQTYQYTMVGADPATSNTTTTIPVDIIPIEIKFKTLGHKYKFDPKPIVKTVLNSPIFQSGIDFVQGGTDLGTTQYIDAFQRGNFWSSVQTNTNYHTLLAPTVLHRQIFRGGHAGNASGVQVALVDINTFDRYLNGLIKTLGIPPTTFPIFLTYNTYLTESGGCCIGGYHSYNGTSTYAMSTFIGQTGAFAQDVSALSHEVGEWYDDPLTNNGVACGILEVGDPLEGGQPGHPYGTYAYPLNGFTYHLQDLVFLPYFGAPASTSVNSWFTFQGYNLTVCQNGG